MSFSDSDWTRDPPRRPRIPAAQRRVLVLAVAIAVSCTALAVAVYGIEQLLDASSRSEEFKRIGDEAMVRPPGAGVAAPLAVASAVEASLEVVTAASGPITVAASETSAEADAKQLASLEAEMRQSARETAERAAVEAVRRKERLWQRFYQRPDFCADNPTAAQMVQCANHHIRARKEFEERYSAGRL
jgi:glycosyltransferase involved in cell wall biosynthesis